MARGVTGSTIAGGGGGAQAGSPGDGASGFILLELGGTVGSFGIFWFGAPEGGGGGMVESFIPVSL